MRKHARPMRLRVKKIKLFIVIVCNFICLTAQGITLEKSVESAIKNDPGLRASKLNQLATDENVAIAQSRLLPQISLQGSSSRLTQTTTQDLPMGGSASRSFAGPSINHQLVLRQALIRPKEMYSLRYAELQSEYMEHKYKLETADLKSKVINAWIDLISSQQIIEALERPLKYLQAATMQERAKLENGDSTKDAVIEIEAQYQNAEVTHIQSIETFMAKKNAFERLVKIQINDFPNKKTTKKYSLTFDSSTKKNVWEKIKNNSLEIKMSSLQVLMQFERMRIAESDHKPTLDIIGAVNLAKNDATSTQGFQYKNTQIGVQYILPLYSGGGVSASVSQARLIYEASLSEKDNTILKVANEFDNNWSQLVISELKKKATYESYLSALEQVAAIKRGLELGTKSIAEKSSAESLLSRRKIDFLNAESDYIKSIFKIKLIEI
jgi:protease secretion system outer membrane protein